MSCGQTQRWFRVSPPGLLAARLSVSRGWQQESGSWFGGPWIASKCRVELTTRHLLSTLQPMSVPVPCAKILSFSWYCGKLTGDGVAVCDQLVSLKSSVLCRDAAPDAMQGIPATVPGGMGTTGAEGCRHQLPLPYAALTVPAPIFRLFLHPPPYGLSPCQALSPPISNARLLVPCTDFFFPSLTPSPATAEVAREQKASSKLAFIIPETLTIGSRFIKI